MNWWLFAASWFVLSVIVGLWLGPILARIADQYEEPE